MSKIVVKTRLLQIKTRLSKFMDDLSSVCYFFSNSPKKQQFFERFMNFYKDDMSISGSDRMHV